MATVTVHIEAYAHDGKRPGVEVGGWEGLVHMDPRSCEDHYPSMKPGEARALAAVLIAQAAEAERTTA